MTLSQHAAAPTAALSHLDQDGDAAAGARTPPAFGAELAAAIAAATNGLRRKSGHTPPPHAPHAVSTALNRSVQHGLGEA